MLLSSIVNKGRYSSSFVLKQQQYQPNIICVGLNYLKHVKETGKEVPRNPTLFTKPFNSIIQHNETIILPKMCAVDEVDYEAELAVIIGKTGKNIKVEDALDYVYGYSAANDVTARKWQGLKGGGQWVFSKSFDTFLPLGPRIVPKKEIKDPQNLAIRSILNGQVMQSSNTKDMVFSVAQIISFISQGTTLSEGSVILTGTPEGVGFVRKPPVYLKEGDEIIIEIEGIGSLRNIVKAEK